MQRRPGPRCHTSPMERQSRRRRASGLAAGVLAILAVVIGAQVAVLTDSNVVGVVSAVVLFGGLWGYVRYLRSRVERQVSAIETTGSFDIDAGLDFSCLPPPWPEKALETVNPAAAANMHSLPVRLVVQDGTLRIDKKTEWMSRRPFHAEVALTEIESVSVGRPRQPLGGSGLNIQLRNGTAVRADLQLGQDRAEAVADLLRARLPRSTSPRPRPYAGLVITSEDPPLRTSPSRAGGLLMLTAIPFPIAMIGASQGPAAAIGAVLVVFYALLGQLYRPPSLTRRLAVGFALTSLAFLIDTVTSGQVWRLVGTFACLGIAEYLRRMSPPSWSTST